MGGIFSFEFTTYLHQHGIKHHTIVPHNHQQNGVVEHMNHTLLNMACAMLFLNNMKLMFWGDVVQYVF